MPIKFQKLNTVTGPDQSPIFHTFRADGWPLCPKCGEDGIACESFRLADLESEEPKMCASFEARCYNCKWTGPIFLTAETEKPG